MPLVSLTHWLAKLRFIELILGGILVAQAAPELPRGEPAQPAARRINVPDFGVNRADDDFDDTWAMNAAIRAATHHCTLYFPAGTYNVKWLAALKSPVCRTAGRQRVHGTPRRTSPGMKARRRTRYILS